MEMENAKLLEYPGRKRGFRQAARQAVRWAGEHPLLCAAVFFVAIFAVRLLCSLQLGTIVIRIRGDEYRYLHLARSIAEGGPLLIQGRPAEFQKILYPLVISPAFLLVKNPITQIKIVGVINCLVMSSVVFPVALLTKRLTQKTSALFLALAFVAAVPDFMYTATFMSEPLYWPVCAWTFYFFHRAIEAQENRKRLLFFAIFGFSAWLVYLTKELGVVFLIAAAAVLAVETIRDRRFLAKNGLALIAAAASFFAPLLIIKYTLFPGVGNSYAGSVHNSGWDQLDISVLRSPGTLDYLIYSAAALLAAAILSFYILPVLLPLFGFREMDGKKRRMYLFSVVSLVVTVGAMAYTVSIREDWGEPLPRLHMRLLAPIVIPFAPLSFDFLLSKTVINQKCNEKLVRGVTAAVCISLLVLLPRFSIHDEWIDHASMTASFLSALLTTFGMDKGTSDLVWLAYLLFMLALTAAGAFFLLKGKKKAVLAMLLCTIFTVSAADNIMSYRLTRLTKRTESRHAFLERSRSKRVEGKIFSVAMETLLSDKSEILRESDALTEAGISISDYILRTDDSPDIGILIALSGEDYAIARYFDTYVSCKLRTGLFSFEELTARLEWGSELELPDEHHVNYIITMMKDTPLQNVEVVYEHAPFVLLRNLDPGKIYYSEQLS